VEASTNQCRTGGLFEDPGPSVSIHVHPEATGAALQKDSTLWFLVFTGPSGGKWDVQLVTSNELSDALPHCHSDADVVAYMEQQLAAAGYAVHRLPRGADMAAWSLTFPG
jgi:hypothetical protein